MQMGETDAPMDRPVPRLCDHNPLRWPLLLTQIEGASGERGSSGAVDVLVDAGDLLTRHLHPDASWKVSGATVGQLDVEVVLLHEPVEHSEVLLLGLLMPSLLCHTTMSSA
jgi:hypothetical protein